MGTRTRGLQLSPHPRPFFVVSSARSGSTSLARILGSAHNAHFLSEPTPTLGRASREVREGRRDDQAALVSDVIGARLQGAEPGRVYGEKNVTLAPFIPELVRQFDANIVHLVRDGREVVRSLLTWHMSLFGSIYREAASAEPLTTEARSAAARLSAADDESDYARHRPHGDTVDGRRWLDLDRFSMCAYYWRAANHEIRHQVETVDPALLHRLDYTRPSPTDVVALGDRLGLVGLTEAQVRESLDARINSVADRGVDAPLEFPEWTEWSSGLRDSFELHAGSEMRTLRLWDEAAPWRPFEFGRFWREQGPDLGWYEWMYDHRRRIHRDLEAFIESAGDFASICDVGCGLAVGYADLLRAKRFRGIDVAPDTIEWCRQHRPQDGHDYLVDDVCRSDPYDGERFDLVFSQGTIDNSYDIDAFLAGVVARSRGAIYVTAYRGFFPELTEHRYSYNPDHACFYNDISPERAQRTLERLGVVDVRIEPIATGHPEIAYETRITGRVSD